MLPTHTISHLSKSSHCTSKTTVSLHHHLISIHGPHPTSRAIHFSSNPHNLFDEMPQRDFKSYNAAIRYSTAKKHYIDAMSTFKTMHVSKLHPDSLALAAVIKSSSTFSNAGLGQSLHGFALKCGFVANASVDKAVMDMYARFNMMDSSCRVFETMGRRDSVTWNILLTGFARAQLYEKAMDMFSLMRTWDGDEGAVEPTTVTLAVVLPICAKFRFLEQGQSLHGYAVKRGLESENVVGNAIVSMYAKCGRVTYDARRSFSLIAYKDVVSWNSLIAGFSENGLFDEAFEVFGEMLSMSFLPNYATVANVLPVCAFVENGWNYGREIHCYLLRFGLEMNISVCNALVTHYSKIGDMKEAESIFKTMHSRDIVTWNAVIAGYASNGLLLRAMDLFHDLISNGMNPDSVTMITILPVCAQFRNIEDGRKIHDVILQHSELSRKTSIGNALISFYGKCGELDSALNTFRGMPYKDLISWNSMLSAFSDNGQIPKLLELFKQMIHEGVAPDSITITSVLQACASQGLRKVSEAHGYSLRAGLSTQPTVGNAVLDAYFKCGSIESACRAFEGLVEKNVVTGNTMISGYLRYGNIEEAEIIFNQMTERDQTTWNLMIQIYALNDRIDLALSLFHELQEEGMRPGTTSLMGILVACTRIASVRLLKQCHSYTLRASFDDLYLKGALLDAYSKCGSIKDASKLFRASPDKDLIIYTSMIGGFAMHGMAENAIQIFNEMQQSCIKPDYVILIALLSACSHAGLVDEGWEIFNSIKEVHRFEPTMEHYACMVDLFARRGRLKEAYNVIKDMPCEANANVWGTLLGSCKTHGDVEIGRIAADHLFEMEDVNIGNYVVMSNIFAADGEWKGVEKVRRLMKSKDLKKPAGCSWIEVEGMRHVFVAGDSVHPDRGLIYEMVDFLKQHLGVRGLLLL